MTFIKVNRRGGVYMEQQTKVYFGDNPSQLYMDALFDLINNGKKVGPRGKQTLELRPVIFEFHKPINRVTMLKGRQVNPFFQLAESLWISAGQSDVHTLTRYNENMATFSDDGVTFNAPYGERLRYWGKNDFRNVIINPIDQLEDCYRKLKKDPDSRQAVAFIGNPHFDNSAYTHNGGKDIACNINIKFKIRDGKLDINVDNRSNDLHWGTFGANLCQFSTIQELMASWLGIPVGTYFQSTDSLHIYTEEYGAKETEKVLRANGYWFNNITEVREAGLSAPKVQEFHFINEPRMNVGYPEFSDLVSTLFGEKGFLKRMHNDEVLKKEWEAFLVYVSSCPDPYFRFTLQAMVTYRCHKLGIVEGVVKGFQAMTDCSWKVSCLRMLQPKYKDNEEYTLLYKDLDEDIVNYIERKG
jgi:thymidylate synthase